MYNATSINPKTSKTFCTEVKIYSITAVKIYFFYSGEDLARKQINFPLLKKTYFACTEVYNESGEVAKTMCLLKIPFQTQKSNFRIRKMVNFCFFCSFLRYTVTNSKNIWEIRYFCSKYVYILTVLRIGECNQHKITNKTYKPTPISHDNSGQTVC